MATRFYGVRIDVMVGGSFEIERRPFKARPTEGDNLVLFFRTQSDIAFHSTTSVASIAEEERSSGMKYLVVEVGEQRDFDHPRLLSELAGSMLKVRDFLNPFATFKNEVVAIPEEDYLVIVNDSVHMDRTVFRKLFSALPLASQAEFVRLNLNLLRLDESSRVTDYSSAAPAIIKFLNMRVNEPLRSLAKTRAIHDRIQAEGLPRLESLVLVDETVVAGNSLQLEYTRYGATCVAASTIIMQSVERTEAEETYDDYGRLSRFLREAQTEVERFGEQKGERRRWQDPIFYEN